MRQQLLLGKYGINTVHGGNTGHVAIAPIYVAGITPIYIVPKNRR